MEPNKVYIKRNKFRCLSLSGGALKGIAYCGVLRYLEENHLVKNIEEYSGTSIGSFFIFMIVLGYTSREMSIFSMNFNFNLLEDINISKFFDNYGISTTYKIEKFIKTLITRRGFDKDITFKQFYSINQKKLSFMCCNLNTFEPHVFNYIKTPDFSIAKACVLSMSIPLIFSNDRVNNDYIVDGVLNKNLPIQLHENKEESLGFSLLFVSSHNMIDSFKDYLSQVNKCMFKKCQDLELKNILSEGYKIVKISSNINSLDFNISKEIRKELIKIGYNTCKEQINIVEDK